MIDERTIELIHAGLDGELDEAGGSPMVAFGDEQRGGRAVCGKLKGPESAGEGESRMESQGAVRYEKEGESTRVTWLMYWYLLRSPGKSGPR